MKVSRVKEGFLAEPADEDPRDIEQGQGEIVISVYDEDTPALIQMLARLAGLPPGRYMFEDTSIPDTDDRSWTLEVMRETQEPVAITQVPRQRTAGETTLSKTA